MNRKECLEKLRTGDKEFHHLYWTNYNKAKSFFKPLIDDMKLERPNVDIMLHHIELGDKDYENWDTVVPLYNDEHSVLHANRMTDETKRKIGNANKVSLNGKKLSQETIIKMIESRKNNGKDWHSTETKLKMSINGKGKGKGKKLSEETKLKISINGKGKNKGKEPWNKNKKLNYHLKWFNNGIKNTRAKECPSGFVSGMLRIIKNDFYKEQEAV